MIDEKVEDKIMQCDINRETANILTLSSGKIDKYEYLTRKKIFTSCQS